MTSLLDLSARRHVESSGCPEDSDGLSGFESFGQSGTQHSSRGSCPAAPQPSPAALGTSGSTLAGGPSNSQGADLGAPTASHAGTYSRDPSPDVPDACPTGAAQPTIVPELRVVGRIRVGRMYDSRERFDVYENPLLRELLNLSDLPADTIVEVVEEETQFTVVDIDTHHWAERPTRAELAANLADLRPAPSAAWVSHGNGLKLMYVGPDHADRALAVAFRIPPDFRVEILRHTRHPGSRSTNHGDAVCGEVVFPPSSNDPFEFRYIGRSTPELRQDALAQLNLIDGCRYDHDRCPIAPNAESDARDCVVVLQHGVFCHRCAGHGVQCEEGLTAGYFPFSRLVGAASGDLDEMAKWFVHWTHARIVLAHAYPQLAERILEKAFKKSLEVRCSVGDPRIANCFNPNLDFVRGDSVWLDAQNFEPTIIDNDAAGGLPYAQILVLNGDRAPTIRIDPVKRAQLKHRTPQGYCPVRAVRGISFAESNNSIPVLMKPAPKYPIELLRQPLDDHEIITALGEAFPLVNMSYLRGCLAAAICAEARIGQPPMLACTGPSGAAKEQHIRLAASILGDDLVKLSLSESDEVFFRQIGVAVTSGHRFLVLDELGKTRNLYEKLKPILELSARVNWRPLHQNRIVTTVLSAAIFYPCVRFPESIINSQEFNRRVRSAHLHRQVPNWRETSGGDTAEWRDRSSGNAAVANSLLTITWRLCADRDFVFDRVADEIGLGRLSDGTPALDPDLMRQLYRHVRGEDGQRVLIQNSSFTRGWVDLDGARAKELISAFVAFDDADNSKFARQAARANLEARSWNDILGIDEPGIVAKVKIHGSKWAMRFQTPGSMRGREILNEELPAIPREPGANHISPPPVVNGCSPPDTVCGRNHTPEDAAAAAQALSNAGFPA